MAPQSFRHRSPVSRSRHRRPAGSPELRCELLEDRTAPAVFQVQNSMAISGLNNNGCVAVADLNKDGYSDAIMTNFGTDYGSGAGSTITVLYNDQQGGFDRVTLNTEGTNVAFASVGDINGDTWPDVVVANANQQNVGSISVFQNNNGNLALVGTPFSTGGNNTSWVGLADITGDNILDVVAANFGKDDGQGGLQGNRITLFQGQTDQNDKGNFTFTDLTPLEPEIQFVPTSVAIADFNNDGIQDIAATSPGIPPDFGEEYPDGVVYLFRGTGSGGFAAPNIVETGGVLPVNIQAGDLNGDNKPDLVVANVGDPNGVPEFNQDSVGVLLNVTSGSSISFGLPNSLTANTHGTFAVAIGDFDLDTDQDIAAVNYGAQLFPPPAAFVSLYLNNGLGTFTPENPGVYDTGTNAGGGQYLAIGNFDDNSTPDLIVAHASNRVGLLTNTSTPLNSTSTALVSSLNPAGFGESVTFTATVTSPSGTVTGGTVTFFDNGVQLGNSVTLSNQQAALTISTLSVGTHSITATYSGAAGFDESDSNTVSQVITSGAAEAFTITAVPANATAGTSFNFTVTARDSDGNVAAGYVGTVHFTSSDGQAVLPADYTFVAGDNGVHTFTATLKTAGTQSLTVTDTTTSSITGTASTTVNAAAASTFTVSGFPSTTTAGSAQNYTVTAFDAFGNIATGYRGTVHFTSTDGQAVLPADYAFTAADNGVHTFSGTLKTAGTQSITGTDTVTGSITGTQSGITVTSGAATSLAITGLPAGVAAGSAQNITVTAKDEFGNTATGFTGTVHFTSTDGQAVLPADYTFTGADSGSHTFSVTLNTPGNQSVTATDTATGSITGSASTTVGSTAATHFQVTAPASTTAGSSFTITVTALNAANGTDAGYRGTVHFTSSDGQAILPANYTFTAGDAGVHTFTVTLATAGNQTVTVTDTVAGSITGNTAITVNAAAASTFTVTAPASVGVGAPFNATVTAKDAFGNTATSYVGTVHFTSSDGQAVLPADYTFTAGDNGVHTFTVTLNTTGSQSVTATDTVTGSITGSANVTVNTSPPPPPDSKPFAIGTLRGPVATVTMYNPDRSVRFSVQPFGSIYNKGVRVAVGDVTGDGVADIVAVTNGGVKAKARVIDGSNGNVLVNNLLGATQYKGKVSVAVGDIDNDGVDEIALGTNQGGPRVRIYDSGTFTKLTGFLAGPSAGLRGNVSVALGDMTGDGKADLVVSALYPKWSRVAGFNGESLAPGATRQRMFTRLTIGGPYVNGLFLAVGDVNGDTRADLVIGTPAARKPMVKVFSGEALVDNNTRVRIANFTPDGSTKNGVRVAVRDIDGDGDVEILTSSGQMVSGFEGGSTLPPSGPPPMMFAFDPEPAFAGAVWVG